MYLVDSTMTETQAASASESDTAEQLDNLRHSKKEPNRPLSKNDATRTKTTIERHKSNRQRKELAKQERKKRRVESKKENSTVNNVTEPLANTLPSINI